MSRVENEQLEMPEGFTPHYLWEIMNHLRMSNFIFQVQRCYKCAKVQVSNFTAVVNLHQVGAGSQHDEK